MPPNPKPLFSSGEGEYERLAADFQDYAYSVSHDLSAPIRAMVEFSKLLQADHGASLNPEGREYLSLIVESGQKLQEMMAGLLQYSRLNTMAKPPARVKMGDILLHCRIILEEEMDQKKAVLEVSELPEVEGDVEQLMILCLILLKNSLTFQPLGQCPHIAVAAEREGDFWRFSVTDNGIGVESCYREKIFELFKRLHGEDDYPGVGMGLSLARKIIHRHDGRIWCDDAPGQGVVFYFTLPAKGRARDAINS